MLIKHFKSGKNYYKIDKILNATQAPCVLISYLDFRNDQCFYTMLEEVKTLYHSFSSDPPILVIDSVGQSLHTDELSWVDSVLAIHPDLKIIHYTTGWDPEQKKYQVITEPSTFFWPLQQMWDDSFSFTVTHHFVCLANHPKAHRTRFINELLNRNLQIRGYFSVGSTWPLSDAQNYFRDHQYDLGIDSQNMKYFPWRLDNIELATVWHDDPEKITRLTYNITDFRITGAMLNVVLESSYESLTDLYLDKPNVPMITEKTVKAFALGQIPLILGPQEIVAKIRHLGFDLFDDIIDTSYDSEPDPKTRIIKAVDSLEQFIKTYPKDSLLALKKTLLVRLRYNRQLAESFKTCDLAHHKLTYTLAKLYHQGEIDPQTPEWLYNTPPFQRNYEYRSQTLLWSGTDTKDRYKKNLADSKASRIIKQKGWDQIPIEYSYNSHGFRCNEFDTRPCALALGCSFTEGTGLPLDMTWPSYLSDMIGLHIWNLGTGGAAVDTVFRILDYYLDKLKPKLVFVLIPPKSRLEYCTITNAYPIIVPGEPPVTHASFAKEWLTQTKNGELNTRKTLLAMQKLCDLSGVPMLYRHSNWEGYSVDPSDLARDCWHPGAQYQRLQADYFYQQYLDLTSTK